MTTARVAIRSSKRARVRPKRGKSRATAAIAETACAAIRQVSGPSPRKDETTGSATATSAG